MGRVTGMESKIKDLKVIIEELSKLSMELLAENQRINSLLEQKENELKTAQDNYNKAIDEFKNTNNALSCEKEILEKKYTEIKEKYDRLSSKKDEKKKVLLEENQKLKDTIKELENYNGQIIGYLEDINSKQISDKLLNRINTVLTAIEGQLPKEKEIAENPDTEIINEVPADEEEPVIENNDNSNNVDGLKPCDDTASFFRGE